MVTVSANATPPEDGPPPRRLSLSQQLLISVHNFGLNFHWGALLAVAIPRLVLRFTTEAAKGRVLGSVYAGGALVALVMQPLAGALSDRSLHPMGRRRPFIIAGVLLNAVALLALAYAPTLGLFILAFLFVQFAYNLGAAAYGGLIPDLVPEGHRLRVLGVDEYPGHDHRRGRRRIADRARARHGRLSIDHRRADGHDAADGLEGPRNTAAAPPAPDPAGLPARVLDRPAPLSQLRLALRGALLHADGGLLAAGLPAVLSQGLPGRAELHGGDRDGAGHGAVGALGSAYVSGWLSDRIGRRPIVSFSSLLMGIMVLVFLVAPSFPLMLALSVVFGIGFGAFNTADLALAVDVLPSREAAAKDLGIWGISTTLPQMLGPLIGGPILDALNRLGPGQGYVAVDALAAAYFVAGALAIWKIRTR